jgi:hypothetical protein
MVRQGENERLFQLDEWDVRIFMWFADSWGEVFPALRKSHPIRANPSPIAIPIYGKQAIFA